MDPQTLGCSRMRVDGRMGEQEVRALQAQERGNQACRHLDLVLQPLLSTRPGRKQFLIVRPPGSWNFATLPKQNSGLAPGRLWFWAQLGGAWATQDLRLPPGGEGNREGQGFRRHARCRCAGWGRVGRPQAQGSEHSPGDTGGTRQLPGPAVCGAGCEGIRPKDCQLEPSNAPAPRWLPSHLAHLGPGRRIFPTRGPG